MIFRKNSKSILGFVNGLIVGAIALLNAKIYIKNVGINEFGVFVLIQSAIILARLPEFGVSSLIVASTAKKYKTQFFGNFNLAIASLVASGVQSFFGIILSSPLILFLMRDADRHIEHDLGSVFFVAAFGGVLMAAVAGLYSYMEGIGRINNKNIINIFSYAFSPFAAIYFSENFGIIGISIVQILIGFLQIILCIFFIENKKSFRNLRPGFIFNKAAFLIKSSFALSFSGLLRAGFEPLTKYAIGFSSGFGDVAIIDIVIKISTQIRALIQGLFQPLLVKFSGLGKNEVAGSILEISGRAKLICFFAAGIFLAVSLTSGYHGRFFFDSNINNYVTYTCIVSVGAIVNIFGLVGYYVDMSRGGGGTVRVTFLMFSVNSIFALIGVIFKSGILVVISYSLIFVVGGFWGFLVEKKAAEK